MHPSIEAAKAIQRDIAGKIVPEGDLSDCELVAGADVSAQGRRGKAAGAVVVWDRRKRQAVDRGWAVMEVDFPYIPGLLSFRELPVLTAAFKALSVKPDVVIVDGQGVAHPRRAGIACHLGLELNLPAVGCAKSRLIGVFAEPGRDRGDRAPLTLAPLQTDSPLIPPDIIGSAVRTRTGVKPLFISIGHLCDLDNAIKLVLSCITKYRLPEPVRAADALAGNLFRKLIKSK